MRTQAGTMLGKKGKYQLDYLLVSDLVRGEASMVRGYDLGSDHRPINANFRVEHKEIWGTAERLDYSQKGWCARTEESKLNFMKGVANDLCWMNDEARGKALVLVEEIIYSHAIDGDSNNEAIRQWNNLQEHRKRLDDLRNMLRQETAREIRKEIRRNIRKEVSAKVRMIKEEQLDKLISGYFDRSKQFFEMQLQDGLSTNKHEWATAAYEYGREKYRDDENDEVGQQERLIRLQLLAQREIEAGWRPLVVKYFILDLPPDCTKYNLPRGFGPTIDVMITSWCTGCWNNVVARGVYRCKSSRSTSRKHLTES